MFTMYLSFCKTLVRIFLRLKGSYSQIALAGAAVEGIGAREGSLISLAFGDFKSP